VSAALPLLPGLVLVGAAWARPEAPEAFCQTYSDAPACIAGAVSCTTCHVQAGPPAHNPYGADLGAARDAALPFGDDIARALLEIEALDSDGDGVSNLEEILAGTEPGFSTDIEPECGEQTGFDNAGWRVGRYDHAFAWKRVMLDFCGRSPRYEEVAAFAEASDKAGVIRETLEACLGTTHWQQVLREISIDVVEPVGPNTDVNILGNWDWDLRLFQYTMSGDRDAREIFTAQYLVVEDPPGSGRLAEIDEPRGEVEAYAQPLPREHRYGIVTTRYSLAMRVMFADMPRTLTAHYYRKLLGLDLARSQGLFPVDELDGRYPWPAPADVDTRGVWQEGCAGCHSTLDALSYPWGRYNGIDLDGDTTGLWLEDRAQDTIGPTTGAIFGETVDGPAEWIDAAANSDAFAQQIVRLFWRRVFQRAPFSCEEPAFESLWRGFAADGYRVEPMLARMVTLDAYGVP
jgi:hypothetical protein